MKDLKSQEKIRLEEDFNAPSGYMVIDDSGNPIPASYYEVELWKIICDLREKLRLMKEVISQMK